MSKPIASLSLDLDNKWSYLKTHGDPGWEQFPSYLDVVVPRVLKSLRTRGLRITFFVVGQDAALTRNHAALRSLAEAGHEIGNHSFHHEPWLHLYDESRLRVEFDRSEEHLLAATGQRPVGFRGPGFSLSPLVLKLLAERGYEYDCSTFPTFLGPLARAYYFWTARLDRAQRAERRQLFGGVREGLRPLQPYYWRGIPGMADDRLLEIPVTTMPLLRVPIHLSYVLYLAGYSRGLARTYWRMALALFRLRSVAPSLLLHPLDFLGCDDDKDLAFFPAMSLPAAVKLEMAEEVLDGLMAHYDVRPMIDHARAAAGELKIGRSPRRTEPGSEAAPSPARQLTDAHS
jgi:peptidoglycan/xylan/chitin deacetylase (PgdA/CDA1 family)